MSTGVETRVPVQAESTDGWALEWQQADAIERAEAARAPRPPVRWVAAGFALGVVASAGAVLPAIYPLSPGYSDQDTAASVVAAVLAATAAIAAVPLAAAFATRISAGGGRGLGFVVLFAAALLSAGAAAIHFAVAKDHFDQYTLFGVFFVLSGIGQLLWALLALFRPTRFVLALGVVANLAIAAVWVVDRIWGLPIGPEHWKPETIGFGDSAASAFELVLVFGCLALFVPSLRARPRPRLSLGVALLLVVAVTTLTVLGLLSAVGVASSFLTPSA